MVKELTRPGTPLRRGAAPDTAWAFTILCDEGYVYDSSVYPIAHDRYGFPAAPRYPHVMPAADGDGLWEVPVGTARFGGTNLPVGGGYFRLVPEAVLRWTIASVNHRERQPVVLYIHPWEFDADQPRPAMSWSHRFRHYVGIGGAERKLRGLLRQFRFTSIEAGFEQVRSSGLTTGLRRAAS